MEPFDLAGPLPTGTTLLEASAGTGMEEKAKIFWDDLKERMAPFLNWERKEMRVD